MAPLLSVLAVHPLASLCVLLFVDGATISCFTTVLLLHYGAHVPAWQAALMGALASALGSVIQYRLLTLLLRSDRPWLRRLAPAQAKVEQGLRTHRAASFATLVLARATPVPDGPVKLIAAWAGYSAPAYGLAIFIGALPYYFALAQVGGAGHFPLPVLLAIVAGLSVITAAVGLLVGRVRTAQLSSPPRR